LTTGGPISLDPAVGALSTLLLGLGCGLYKERTRAELLRLLVWIYPGHLQGRAGRKLPPAELESERGFLLRRELEAEGRGAPDLT
jgi:protein-arginine kinase